MIITDKDKYQILIANSKAEIGMRLGIVQNQYQVVDILTSMQELDKIIESVRLIKRAILHLKNTT